MDQVLAWLQANWGGPAMLLAGLLVVFRSSLLPLLGGLGVKLKSLVTTGPSEDSTLKSAKDSGHTLLRYAMDHNNAAGEKAMLAFLDSLKVVEIKDAH